jgi:hypothetical protein
MGVLGLMNYSPVSGRTNVCKGHYIRMAGRQDQCYIQSSKNTPAVTLSRLHQNIKRIAIDCRPSGG